MGVKFATKKYLWCILWQHRIQKFHTLLEVNFSYVLMVLSVRYAGVREKRTLSFEQKTIYKQASLSIKCVTNANKVLKLLVYQIYFGIIM